MPRNNLKYDIDYAKVIFLNAGCILLETEYKSCDVKMKYICSCGNHSEIRFKNFLDGVRCKKCAIDKTTKSSRHSFEYVYNYFKEHGCELLEGSYKNNSTKMHYKCSCGNDSYIGFGNFRKGKRCKDCGIKKLQKENNPNWNPERTQEQRVKERKTPEYHNWRMSIFERDKYKCKLCGDKRGILVAHHLNSYTTFIEQRYDTSNGIALCDECHKNFHHLFGIKSNTQDQFKEFVEINKKSIEEVMPS